MLFGKFLEITLQRFFLILSLDICCKIYISFDRVDIIGQEMNVIRQVAEKWLTGGGKGREKGRKEVEREAQTQTEVAHLRYPGQIQA